MDITYKQTVLKKAVDLLQHLKADYVIKVEGLRVVESSYELPTPATAPAGPINRGRKRREHINGDRNRAWGYHDKIKALTPNGSVTFTLPADATPDGFIRVIRAYAGVTHKQRSKTNWPAVYDKDKNVVRMRRLA
jgi:hypothetical protein